MVNYLKSIETFLGKKSVLTVQLLVGRKPVRVKECEHWIEISVKDVGSSASYKIHNGSKIDAGKARG